MAAYVHPWDRNLYNKRTFFQPFINPLDVEFGLEGGTLYQGIMRLTKNPADAYVKSDDLDFDIYIGGFNDRNRALDGDLVAVQLKDVDEVWELRKERQRRRKETHLQRQKEKLGEEEQEQTQVPAKIENEEEGNQDEETEEGDEEDHKPAYCGHVISIIEKAPNANYTGYFIYYNI
jgi:protein SSD1